MTVRNIKLIIQYDGSDYHGWQIQPGQKTIQGTLSDVIQNLIGCKVQVFGASRTDAGVSALGQVALAQIDSPIPTENLAKAITDRLPADIVITEAVEMPNGFDIIGAATRKLYRYTIFTGPTRPALQIRHCWYIPAELDTVAMDRAAKMLVGKKDFKSFASAADKRQNSVRTIFQCDVNASCEKKRQKPTADIQRFAPGEIEGTQYDSDWIYVNVEGNAFLYNMVRNIVGTLIEVGKGKLEPEKIKQIIEAKDRTAAGPIAPAAGLCLVWIKY
ncbi:MAG: tRNA pseudouridine(38-40) synthase TruA [Sedimentisphaerales bacterium]|nr:tRNA pseudouridine(38-40) synthase TruA [Sedimentisphaerales bacterium]